MAYHQAVKIAQLAYTTIKSPVPQRISVEVLSCPIGCIETLMWIPIKLHPLIMCPTLSYTLAVWDRQRVRKKLCFFHTPLVPILNNAGFTPGLLQHLFQWWENKCVFQIGDFLSGNDLHTLDYYKKNLQLLLNQTFQYNQIFLP